MKYNKNGGDYCKNHYSISITNEDRIRFSNNIAKHFFNH